MKANPTILPGLLLGIVFLAACSEHSVTTAPSADAAGLSPAGFIGDRTYTWDLKCSGDFASEATWSWTTGGVSIVGTEMSLFCSSALTGSGTRPAAADGFSACVNYLCQSWTFDPTGPFKTHLKGTASIIQFFQPGCDPFGHIHQYCYLTATATLTVDS